MTFELIAAGVLGIPIGALLALLILPRPSHTTTWICTLCLQGFSRYGDAQTHLNAVHPRHNQH